MFKALSVIFLQMSWLTAFCNLLAIVSVSGMYFDCRKDGHDCLNGGVCNNSTGSCSCIQPYFGFNCEVSEDQRISGSFCVPNCQHGGTCSIASSVRCYCPDTHFGTNCEQERASVSCNDASMQIRIVPFMRFAGLVYIQGHKDDPDCRFTVSADPVTEEVIYQLNRGAGTCSMNRSTDTPNAGDITYSINLVVQYARFYDSSLDVRGNVNCVVPKLSTGSQTGTIVLEQRPVTIKYTDKTYRSPVKLALQKESGEELSYPLYLGTQMRLFLTLMDRRRYNGIILQSCSVADDVDTKLAKQNINLIVNGCLTKKAAGIVSGNIIYNGDSKEVTVYFSAFRFPRHPSVAFNCEIDLCSGPCSKPVCDSSVHRRKRFSSNPTLAFVIVHDNITVIGRSEKAGVFDMGLDSSSVNEISDKQKLDIEVKIPLVILLVLVVIVILSSTIIVFVRSRNARVNENNVDIK